MMIKSNINKKGYFTITLPFWLSLLSASLILWCKTVSCVPPEEPIKCSNGNSSCTVTNTFGSFPDRSICRVVDVVYPENEDQLISYVRDATKNKRKVKVMTRYGHSAPKLVCPDGTDGLIISTKNLNKLLNINFQEQTLTVETGMTLLQLKDEAAKANLALPASPYWAGVTVGGMIGTGAHGSSIWGRGSAVHDYVVGLRIVSPGLPQDDFVKVRTLGVQDGDLDAVKVSLGVLGVISQVTFKLEAQFKRNVTYVVKDDSDLEGEALTFGSRHEFADITWLPSQRKAVYRIDNRVPATTPGNGVYDNIGFEPFPQLVMESIRGAEDFEESLGLASLRCTNARATTEFLRASAFGLKNNGIIFTGYPVIGYQNSIQASAQCVGNPSGYCAWDNRIKGQFYWSNGFFLPFGKVKSFISEIRNLVNIEPRSLCGLESYNGILMRYIKASSAYLGKDEDGIEFDVPYYRSREPLGHRLYGDVLDEIEQMAIFKYGALPHWGKNRNIAFIDVIAKYKDAEMFLRIKKTYDPIEIFSNEWTDQIFGLKGEVTLKTDGCAREGLCICTKDSDCGPNYSCQEGRVYKDAKVCRLTRPN